MTTTDQYVTIGYSADHDAYRVEVDTVGDPIADEIIELPDGTDASEHNARTVAATVAAERGLSTREVPESSS